MTGIEKVRARVQELGACLSPGSEWILVREPARFLRSRSVAQSGCISCHFGYFLVASVLADQLNSDSIACGFVGYQNTWVEQTPYAIHSLQELLAEHDKHLILPVADIRSRAQAEAELRAHGLSTDSMELKCFRQEDDPALTGSQLQRVVDKWSENLREALSRDHIPEPPLERLIISSGVSK
jgi:hypothetical protein